MRNGDGRTGKANKTEVSCVSWAETPSRDLTKELGEATKRSVRGGRLLFVVEQKKQLNLMLVWMCWGTMAMRTPKGVGSGDNEYTAG